jgi:hypothetical protein
MEKKTLDLLVAFENGEITLMEAQRQLLLLFSVSGSASDFEMELYKLINRYVSAGLKKPDLVAKMGYVIQSCRVF